MEKVGGVPRANLTGAFKTIKGPEVLGQIRWIHTHFHPSSSRDGAHVNKRQN